VPNDQRFPSGSRAEKSRAAVPRGRHPALAVACIPGHVRAQRLGRAAAAVLIGGLIDGLIDGSPG